MQFDEEFSCEPGVFGFVYFTEDDQEAEEREERVAAGMEYKHDGRI